MALTLTLMTKQFKPLGGEAPFAEYLRTYPIEITFGEDPAEEVFDRYHTEDYVLVNDGLAMDRQRILGHVAPARKRARTVSVEVRDVIVSGDRVAARYVLTADMRRGDRIITEVHLFGRLADDGRLCQVDQLTRDIGT